MSKNDYLLSQHIAAECYPFYALMLATYRKATNEQAAQLHKHFLDADRIKAQRPYDDMLQKYIEVEKYTFEALIMALMRQADTFNAAALRIAFPDVISELVDRYNAPGGDLPGEYTTPE